MGVLIIDGYVINVGGMFLDDMKFFIVKVRNMKSCGIILCVVGLGDVVNFNIFFLIDLSD